MRENCPGIQAHRVPRARVYLGNLGQRIMNASTDRGDPTQNAARKQQMTPAMVNQPMWVGSALRVPLNCSIYIFLVFYNVFLLSS